jgi:hypothetical protein
MYRLIFLLVFIMSPFSVEAATYWVDDNGSASWENCTGVTPLEGSSACAISTANNNASPGDIVYLRSGTYSKGIAPAASGSSGNEITFSAYDKENVVLAGMETGVDLEGDNYINVTGITVTGTTLGLWIDSGDYNTISYCTFGNHTGRNWDANAVYNNAQYNHIHHSTFHTGGECTSGGSDDGAVIRIGREDVNDNTRYNLIEDSTFYHGGHHVFGLHGNHNIIRNNYMFNEAWTNGAGNRTLYLNGQEGYTGHNLIEGNRFGYAAIPCDDVTVGNAAISTPYNIFRYNYLYHHNAYGLGFGSYAGDDTGAYNRVYNNTFHNSGYNIHPSKKGSSEDAAVVFFDRPAIGNILKNNLYNIQRRKYGAGSGGSLRKHTFVNEYDDKVNGNPLFANATGTPPADKTDSSLPDFTLNASSPAIDFGGALTNVGASDTGSGTSLIVDDARYFQDGTWSRSGLVDADWIAVGTPSNVARIKSINYLNNTISLASLISRRDNDEVWLYKDSGGTVVLYGARPDAGANEYSNNLKTPAAPSDLKIIE